MRSIAEVRAAMTAPGQPFEMDEIDIRGVRTRVWKHAPPTLRDVLEASRAHGDADFIVYEGDRLTFAGHYARAAELEFGLRDSGARVLVADAQRAERLAGVLPGLDAAVLVARPGDTGAPAGAEDFDAVVDAALHAAGGAAAAAPPDVALEPEDDATIFYTSGTTGRPKGALGTHRNITGNPIGLAYGLASAGVRAGRPVAELMAPQRRVTLLSVPLFHATGCHSVLVSSALQGGTVVLMYKWDAAEALRLIERERVTGFGGVPTMAWQVLTSPDFDAYDTSSLTGVSYGGAPAAPALVDTIRERLPDRVPGNGYGLTETSSVTTYNGGVNYLERPDSVGPPVAVCDVKASGRTAPTCRRARSASC
ncbi:class I adenylate-forming enzyme family protein [Actinomadura sp. WAC 06369]|uniref:class I adenylate-forming enzyme family protein n=1 Tax=Actinomadura sp. WAC 06369 TaxID=2203193 RepID=UPI00227836DC|nr:class I adenylate-forming enzyme family protein [Actinomadura sp. WAC 06369]